MQHSLFHGRPLPGLTAARQAQFDASQTEHGGVLRRGQRKIERPVSGRRPMHVVLASRRATGHWSLRRHQLEVKTALRTCVRRTGIKVYAFANVGSHVHLLLRARGRPAFQAFLRSFAGMVAQAVTGARRGRPVGGGRFWSSLAWSRVVAWGHDYRGVQNYIYRNRVEATHGRVMRLALEMIRRRPSQPARRPRSRSPTPGARPPGG